MRRPKLRFIIVLSGLMILALLFMTCQTLKENIGILSGGKVSTSDVEAVEKTTEAVRKSFAEITDEEEYYIGRAVSAMILSQYPVYKSDAVTKYINRVGYAVVIHSDRPETYAGYHFLILDTEEVNALAAPGGFIFITKGLLKRCQDEEMLSSILAHEVGHVSAKHGLQSIKKSRLIDAFRIIGSEATKRYAPEKLAQLTDIFEDTLGDIAEKLIESGYDRKYEYEADKLSVKTSVRTGYDANGLLDFLGTMVDDTSTGSEKGWFKTHPTAKDRIGRVQKEISAVSSMPAKNDARTNRFQSAMKALK
ncbi:MAG: M48 family metalloprotease [Candidatus Aminicenantes bacterium]|nr:MAG: M48 family metalloprotease [Candidatus Aminicenantes bacterium]